MACFSLVIEYLTGYSVATDPSTRERPEWPPHPARVYMALAAAHFEADGLLEDKRAEREALEWLATLPPPDLVVPPHTDREVRVVYVPVNDQAAGEAIVRRSRQPRTFPRVYVGDQPVRFIWQVDPASHVQHMRSLESICRHVSRIGHSSSLVWARIEPNDGGQSPTLIRADHGLSYRLRVVSEGALDRLESAFNRDATDAYASLESEVASSAGVAKKKLNQEKATRFPGGAPLSQRPNVSLHQGYGLSEVLAPSVQGSFFDPAFIVLRGSDESPRQFGLETTARLVEALRGPILSTFGKSPIPSWISGHEPSGEKLQHGSHLALAPLAFVGSQYADGHLLGMAIMIPRQVSLSDRGRALAALLFDESSGAEKPITLNLGSLGVWSLIRDSSGSGKQTLQTRTYTEANFSWASVTPIVLDRLPKSDRAKDPVAWRQEVAGIIATSCENIGLPAPVAVRVEKTPFFFGSLRAMPGQGGFPQLRKGTFQVHAAIVFDRPVMGPLLLGAGRFRGYGLMRPWKAAE